MRPSHVRPGADRPPLQPRGTERIVFKPLPKDDPRQRQPDITRARMLLGWEPKVPYFRKPACIAHPPPPRPMAPSRFAP